MKHQVILHSVSHDGLDFQNFATLKYNNSKLGSINEWFSKYYVTRLENKIAELRAELRAELLLKKTAEIKSFEVLYESYFGLISKVIEAESYVIEDGFVTFKNGNDAVFMINKHRFHSVQHTAK